MHLRYTNFVFAELRFEDENDVSKWRKKILQEG
jgi:hypothetical protein